jgi:DNA-directed RNA polymerase specialized sigma24 family protein
MIPRLYPNEVLTICHLKQWAQDRTAIRAGHTTNYEATGYRKRRSSDADARVVRVVDFERAMSFLPEQDQAILLLTYRDHFTYAETSCIVGVSVRTLCHKIPVARKRLAAILEHLSLL